MVDLPPAVPGFDWDARLFSCPCAPSLFRGSGDLIDGQGEDPVRVHRGGVDHERVVGYLERSRRAFPVAPVTIDQSR